QRHACLVLRGEDAQRVTLEARSFERRQLTRVRPVVRGELLDIGGPADRVADRVQLDNHVLESGLAVEAVRELDDLRVYGRTRVADGLDAELPELTIPAGLRPVVAEHRPDHGELDRLGPRLHAVLDVGTNDPRGRLGPERPALAVLLARREQEQLLFDDVGDLAEPAFEHRGLLEQRRLDRAVAVPRGELAGDAIEPRHGGALGR